MPPASFSNNTPMQPRFCNLTISKRHLLARIAQLFGSRSGSSMQLFDTSNMLCMQLFEGYRKSRPPRRWDGQLWSTQNTPLPDS